MPRPASAVVTSKPARFVLALLRIAVGFVFLWSFLDKTFGLHYSTGPSRAWINGGTPAQSYLTGATTGKPLASFFESLAMPAMDWLFMLGLLGIGLAFLLGIGTRLAAVAGVVMLGFMYAAVAPWVWGSLNPVVNEHLVYALVLILIPLTSAGDTLGLGAWWKGLGLVKKLPFLICFVRQSRRGRGRGEVGAWAGWGRGVGRAWPGCECATGRWSPMGVEKRRARRAELLAARVALLTYV